MSKNKRKKQVQSSPSPARKVWIILAVIGALAVGGASALLVSKNSDEARSSRPVTPAPAQPASPAAAPVTPPAAPPQPATGAGAAMETMEVAKAVMVTQE